MSQIFHYIYLNIKFGVNKKTYFFNIIFGILVFELQFFYRYRFNSENSVRLYALSNLSYYSKGARANCFENFELFLKRSRSLGNLRLLLGIIDNLLPSLEGTPASWWLLLGTIIHEVWHHKGRILKLTVCWLNKGLMKIDLCFFGTGHRYLRSMNCLLSGESMTSSCGRCWHLSHRSKSTTISMIRNVPSISSRFSSWNICFLDNWY
jgi:hypothetical protein